MPVASSNYLGGRVTDLDIISTVTSDAKLHGRAQIRANELAHLLVRYVGSQFAHKDVVVDFVEERFQVDVHHPVFTGFYVALGSTHGIVRTAIRPEAVAMLAEDTLTHCA